MWREVHDIFAYHEANNVLWCWNIAQSPSKEEEMRVYYPGDEYVDILSFEMRYGDDTVPQRFFDIIEGMMALAADKPIITGEHAPPTKASVMDSWHSTFKKYPRYKGWLYWTPGKYDWEVDQSSSKEVQDSHSTFIDHERTYSKTEWQRYLLDRD